MPAPLSVIIPALNAEPHLPRCLGALMEGVREDLIRQVILVDGGSADATAGLADAAGCEVLTCAPGRAKQLIAGAARAQGDWLLFLHADTALATGWAQTVRAHMSDAPAHAACFQLAFDVDRPEARWLARRANQRTRWFALPYGDQGLLLPRTLYTEVGGFSDIPLMEDVAIVRAIGRRRLRILPTLAVTSAAKYERDGWRGRSWRNAWLLVQYLCGADPTRLARRYT